MILYHPNGETLSLRPAVWRRALALAASAGWRPAGTLPPPSDLERPPGLWHGAYEPALGQEVTRCDAAALAAALCQALELDPHARQDLASLALSDAPPAGERSGRTSITGIARKDCRCSIG